jgi:glycogen phosphorylase
MNLRWSWHPETRDLFEALDPDLWQRCGGDPVKVLGEVSAERLAQLAKDRKFVRRLQDAVDDLEEYLATPRWYQSLGKEAPAGIAYFSVSSASPRSCRSTPAAWASWPATTSRLPPTSVCR